MQTKNDNVCLSGGAIGADTEWATMAKTRGDSVIHFIFRGHKYSGPKEDSHVLTKEQLMEADPALVRANKILKRIFPSNSAFVNNLLRRNYYQVIWSDACYAVAQIDRDGHVKGGTAWATTMFTDMHPDKPCFVYDQHAQQWFKWKGGWCPVMTVPSPSGTWTGIGSRDLLLAGKNAIKEIMNG